MTILLPQPPEGWDYRWEPTCPILPIDLRAFRGRLRFSPSFPSSSGTLGCVEVRRRDGDAGGQSGKVTPAWGGNMDQAGLVSAMGTGSQGTGCQGPGGHPPFRRLGLHEVSSDRGRWERWVRPDLQPDPTPMRPSPAAGPQPRQLFPAQPTRPIATRRRRWVGSGTITTRSPRGAACPMGAHERD
jgi:hypothetical protein